MRRIATGITVESGRQGAERVAWRPLSRVVRSRCHRHGL